MTSQIRKQKTADSEVDRYLQESCKSYKECEIKNNARRNSLQKRTLGIETERKMANANLSREEKQLREQLKQMQIEKAKNDIMHNMRGKNTHSLSVLSDFSNIYPLHRKCRGRSKRIRYYNMFVFSSSLIPNRHMTWKQIMSQRHHFGIMCPLGIWLNFRNRQSLLR